MAALSAAIPPVTAEASLADNSILVRDDSGIPVEMMELMRNSRSKYLEGSSLLRAGDSDKAREAFNKSVDMLLQSEWDVASTPALNLYFQDLIQRIQEDESLYLPAPLDPGDKIETAVVDDLDKLDLASVAVDSAVEDAPATDSPEIEYGIPITINEMVTKSMDYWLNRGRKCFVDGLLRSGQYRQMIEKIFREESIPLDLMYLAQVESLFKTNAVSKAKARGIWQFQRGTAIRYGLKVTRDVDERSDPEKSTRAAARYLNDLYAMFQDWNLVLAAYNWGEGKVQRLINRTGLNDFWKLVDLKRKLPKETKNHVPMIQASVILARNPEKYGLPTELHPPLEYAEVTISKPIDLGAAAKALSTSVDELKKLNPSLRGYATPANYPDFKLKVPVDSTPEAHERLAALPTAKLRISPEFDGRHKVRPGETLSGIAAKYRVSVAKLAQANSLSLRSILRAGIWLEVPSSSSNLPAGKTELNAKKKVSTKNKNAVSSANASSSKNAAASSKGKLAFNRTATPQTASR